MKIQLYENNENIREVTITDIENLLKHLSNEQPWCGKRVLEICYAHNDTIDIRIVKR